MFKCGFKIILFARAILTQQPNKLPDTVQTYLYYHHGVEQSSYNCNGTKIEQTRSNSILNLNVSIQFSFR
jgi:hypothetical protein